MTTVADRVAAGAAILDERRPDWFKSIDCATLDIASAQQCVCGQLFGSYFSAIRDMGIDGKSADYGFSVGNGTTREEINSVWRELIAARRLAEVPALVTA